MKATVALKSSGTLAVLGGTVAVAAGLESHPGACLYGSIAFGLGLLVFVAGRILESAVRS